jgi:hypothetical protein
MLEQMCRSNPSPCWLAGVAESKARYFKKVGRYAFGLLVGLKILDA